MSGAALTLGLVAAFAVVGVVLLFNSTGGIGTPTPLGKLFPILIPSALLIGGVVYGLVWGLMWLWRTLA